MSSDDDLVAHDGTAGSIAKLLQWNRRQARAQAFREVEQLCEARADEQPAHGLSGDWDAGYYTGCEGVYRDVAEKCRALAEQAEKEA